MLQKYFLLFLLCLGEHALYSQVIEPNLQDETLWTVANRKATPVNNSNKKAVSFNEVASDGLMILKGSDFSNGIVELDIKGSSKFQQSFVGFAFHMQGLQTYDAIYFRPFNFKSNDAVRRSHAVQYISMPEYDWEKLSNEFLGKYENKIDNALGGNDWFHVKIVVNGSHIAVFVNNAQQASLEVEKLNANQKGGVGLWLGNNSGGSFANLKIIKTGNAAALSPSIPYGNSPQTEINYTP